MLGHHPKAPDGPTLGRRPPKGNGHRYLRREPIGGRRRRTNMRPAQRRYSPLLLSLAAVLLAVSACSSSGGDGGGDDSKSSAGSFEETSRDAADAPVAGPAEDEAHRNAVDADGLAFDSALAESVASQNAAPDVDRSIIAKGNVSLESDDVAGTVFDVQEITDDLFGEITERETTTNKNGDINTARLLLRIPVASFDDAFDGLQKVADLKSANTGKEDVTTQVIDTRVRIRAQRLSLARVEALFDRAQSISDIIRIESQVSRRQADLESLEKRLSYLKNQTSMSTISVSISLPPPEKKEKKEEPEEAGFFAGLEDGWHGLKSFSTDLATLSGRLLPFGTVLLVVGGPIFLLVRRFRRRGGSAPSVPTPAGP